MTMTERTTSIKGLLVHASAFMAGVVLANPGAAERATNPRGASRIADPVARMNARGFAMLHMLYMQRQGGDAFISPYSIDSVFGIAWLAAGGATRREIGDCLGFQNDAADRFRSINRSLVEQTDVKFHSANSLWVDPVVQVADYVAKPAKDCFRAEIQKTDFIHNPEAARSAINRFITEHTAGKIVDPIRKRSIDEQARAVVVNALYFSGAWEDPFETSKPCLFTLGDGRKIQVPMLADVRELLYFEDKRVQAVWLPYKGERFSFIAILPTETEQMGALLRNLRAGYFERIIDESLLAEVVFLMPKIDDKDFNADLNELLPACGVKRAFNVPAAEFPGLKAEEGVCISRALHFTRLTVDEVRTEAVAATVVCCVSKGGPMPIRKPRKRFHADRPYVVAIYDRETSLALFVGVIANPLK